MPESRAAIELTNITKRFPNRPGIAGRIRGHRAEPVTALEGVSLKVDRGEVYGLVGPNGSGKTTLIKVCATLQLPDEGSGSIAGIPLEDTEGVRARIGLLTDQERSFFWRLTCGTNLQYFGRLFDLGRERLGKRIKELSELLDLGDLLGRRYDRCSAGMKQRIALARSLLIEPEVLLLDEPTRSLDPVQSRSLVRLLKRVAGDRGIAILASSHNLEHLSECADRTGLLLDGHLIEMGSSLARGVEELGLLMEGDKESIAAFAAEWGEIHWNPGSGNWRVAVPANNISTREGGWSAFLRQLTSYDFQVVDLQVCRQDLRQIYESAIIEAEAGSDSTGATPVEPAVPISAEGYSGRTGAGGTDSPLPRKTRPAILKALDLLFVEARTWLSYRFSLLFGLVGVFLLLAGFMFISRMIGQGNTEVLARYGGDYFTFVVVGIAFAGLQSVALNSLAGMIRKHQQLGTLEFLMLSATPFDRILLASTVLSLFGVLGTMGGYVFAGWFLFDAEFSQLRFAASIVVFAVSASAILGFGLLAAGAVMVLKRADTLLFSLHSIMLFFGGVFFPVELLPGALRSFSQILPITHALSAMRQTLIVGAGITDVGGELLILALFAILGLPLGVFAFRLCERKARLEGTLLEF